MQHCNFNHNPNRHSAPSSYESVGENIYASSGSIDYRAAVEAWYNEVIEIGYEFENRKCSGPDPTACLHYTQVYAQELLHIVNAPLTLCYSGLEGGMGRHRGSGLRSVQVQQCY